MIKIKNKKVNLGIVLIVIGIIWILSNLNLINVNVYNIVNYMIRGVFDLWPLILVIVGINIMFKREGLNTILWILFFIVLIVYSLFIKGNILEKTSNGNLKDEIYTVEMREDIEKGKLDLDVGATSFNIDPIDDDFAKLEHDGTFNYKFSRKGNEENLYISNEIPNDILNNKNKRSFELGLNKEIPWELDLDVGAISGNLNLKDIMVKKLDVDMGAGKIEITLGDKAELTSMDIDAGASQIILNIPESSGLKLNYDGALNSTNFDDLGLIKTENGKYVSDNFNAASSKYEIEVDMGVGQFSINYY
ncbi:LiaI-LiaF-like domain-containing protein [Tissierella creatinophila]|uniref:LiaI-LiaF-like transmembrane region domain-containing protein n=1 Tax=Tissierella creatinophila DSM 6911 TaxID=1123403 RepID=A0A1U7M8H0_TISCR|nr:DUF5668 domain-containing protein [Tissierella creatinophila]OLS03612.1 hypothetical protein TICRE_03060 [Tissierella creatinophila DSM 6911]